jgi:uncharacterized protein (TIGR03086 family)
VTDALFSIGDLARRTGMSVKMIRYWSDAGVVPPTGRTHAGYRRYDAAAVARLELVRTLRDLGLSLEQIRAVTDRERGIAEVAAAHADALDAQIRVLKIQRAVLRSVADRGSTTEELTLMTRLARLSAAERNRIIADFVENALADLDLPTYRAGLLAATPALPDEPTPAQVDAWIELAELVAEPETGAALRRMAEYGARHAPGPHDEAEVEAVKEVAELFRERADAALAAGTPPDSPLAEPIVAGIIEAWLPTQKGIRTDGSEARELLREQLESTDERIERYWRLISVINGWPEPPRWGPAGAWLVAALRANPEPGGTFTPRFDMVDPATIVADFDQVVADVERLVGAVGHDQWTRMTPCDRWTVRDLVDHMIWENLAAAALADGKPREDHDADHAGTDPAAAFRAAVTEARTAFTRPGMVTDEYGPYRAPGAMLVQQVIIELLTHGWDLAVATGRPTDLAPAAAERTLAVAPVFYGRVPRTPGSSFGPERPAPADATATDRLAAYLGRSVVDGLQSAV